MSQPADSTPHIQQDLEGNNNQTVGQAINSTIVQVTLYPSSSQKPCMPTLSELPGVEAYLRSLFNDKKQELYTPLRAELVKPKEKYASGEPEEEEQREQVEQWKDVLEGLEKYATDHALLVGKPGSGKSNALQQLLCKEARNALVAIEKGETDFKIPVLIKLRDRKEEAIVLRIQRELRRARLDSGTIENLLLEGRFLLLFDGLNEIPTSIIWSELKEFQDDRDFYKNPRIFTTRELGTEAGLGLEKKLILLPLTDLQMQTFVENYLRGRSEVLLSQLKHRLNELAETPLLLKILCDVVEESPDGQLPDNRGELFRQEFARRYQAFKPKHGYVSEDSRRLAERLLQQLAFEMTQGKSPTDADLQISKDQAIQILQNFLQAQGETDSLTKASEYLEDLLEWDLLQVASDVSQIEFHHQLFQEYYAAEYLLRQLPSLLKDEDNFKRNYLNYLKWREPIVLMLALPEVSKNQALKVVDLALEVDWRLGAQFAGNVISEWQIQTVAKVCKLEVPPTYKIQLLGNTHSDVAVQHLLEKLTSEQDENLILESAFALRELSRKSAIPGLLNTLHHDNPIVVASAIFALGAIGDSPVVLALQQALRHPNDIIREESAKALGELNIPTAIPDLVETLKADKNEQVRIQVVEALGRLTAELAIPDLVNIALKDSSKYLRWVAIRALAQINCDRATQELLDALKAEDKEIRQNAAEALGKMGSEAAIEKLVLALQDGHIRWQVAKALKEIGGKKVVSGLIPVLQGDTPLAAECAAWTLGELDNADAIPSLIKSLDHWYPELVATSVEALGKLGDTTVIPLLHKLLQSQLPGTVYGKLVITLGLLGDEQVLPELLRIVVNPDLASQFGIGQYDLWRAIKALEAIGNQTAICELIQLLNKSAVPNIRWEAAKALGCLGDVLAVDGLLTALTDKNSTVRTICAEALGKLNCQVVLPKLLGFLQSSDPSIQDPNIREAFIRVFGYIEDEASVEEPVNFLRDTEFLVRFSAVEALVKLSNSPSMQQKVSQVLSYSWKMKFLHDGFFSQILAIQSNCKFYNYEVAQLEIEPDNSQVAGASQPIFQIKQVGNLNTGNVTIQGDQKGFNTT